MTRHHPICSSLMPFDLCNTGSSLDRDRSLTSIVLQFIFVSPIIEDVFPSFLFLSLVLIECFVKKIIITRVFDFLKKLYFIYFHTWNSWNWKRACPLSLWPFKYIINIYYYFSLQNLILKAIKQWSIRLDFIFSFAKDTKYHICTSNKIFHS